MRGAEKSRASVPASGIRLDKWLWAARFFKQRKMAREAIDAGRVLYNNQRCKPGREVLPGAELSITRAQETFVVTVMAVSEQRGPASEASRLYAESEDSVLARSRAREALRVHRMAQMPPARRPNKQQRRHIHRFTRQQEDHSQ